MPDPNPPVINAEPPAPPQPSPIENMPAPRVPTEQQPESPFIPMQGEEATNGARHGILSALMPEVKYVQTPQGPQQVQVPTSPGDAFRRILAGALVGMGAGAANPGRAGIFGGLGTGAAAVMNREVANDQLARQNAQKEFENNQQAQADQQRTQLNQATIAHLAQQTAESTWRVIREQGAIDESAASELNKMRERVAADPNNKSYGQYASFDDFLAAHQDNVQQFADKMAKGSIQPVTVYSGGKPVGVEVFEINPAWSDQKNSSPVKVPFIAGTDDKGKPKVDYKTIPAGGISNGEIWKAETAVGNELLKGAVTPEKEFEAQQQMNRERFVQANENARAEREQEIATGKLTSSTRTMIEAAPKVVTFVDRIDQLIDEQQKSLGPAASRWSEFMAGKVGAPNPEFTKLRTDVGLLQTLLMRMHVGARGGEYIMKHFQDLFDSGKQSPENLKAALAEVKNYAQELQAEGGGSPAPSPAPSGASAEVYAPDGKTLIGHVVDGKYVPAGKQ